jgi:Kelch motif
MSRALLCLPRLTLSMLAVAACTETPTQPETGGDPGPAALSLATARNAWTPRAASPFDQYTGDYVLGMAPNAAGQTIVYTFGSSSSDDGATGGRVLAYNVASNTWSTKASSTHMWLPNGVGKIGSRLYFSGGYSDSRSLPTPTRELWAYDYSHDLMIRKAPLPIYGAEGVSGVIDRKLYVLPGACSGYNYPNPGYCLEEPTRRFYRYDPATNTWVTRRQAPHFHRKGAAVVINGKLYVAGGLGPNGTAVSALDVYDPTTNTWRTLASMPTGGVAAGTGLRGQFYVVVAGSPARTYAYSPVTNQWKTRAAAPSYGFGSVSLVARDGLTYLFMATGNQSWLYTP